MGSISSENFNRKRETRDVSSGRHREGRAKSRRPLRLSLSSFEAFPPHRQDSWLNEIAYSSNTLSESNLYKLPTPCSLLKAERGSSSNSLPFRALALPPNAHDVHSSFWSSRPLRSSVQPFDLQGPTLSLLLGHFPFDASRSQRKARRSVELGQGRSIEDR